MHAEVSERPQHWTGQLRQDWWSKAALTIKLKLSENWEKRSLPRIIPNIFLLNVQILQNYKDNSRIRRLLKNLDFYVLPVLNIDGYIYTWTTVSTLSLVLGWVHELDLGFVSPWARRNQTILFIMEEPLSGSDGVLHQSSPKSRSGSTQYATYRRLKGLV